MSKGHEVVPSSSTRTRKGQRAETTYISASPEMKAPGRPSDKKSVDLKDEIKPKSQGQTKASVRVQRRSQPLFDLFNAPTLKAGLLETLVDFDLLLRAKMSTGEFVQATPGKHSHEELLKLFDERKYTNGISGNGEEEEPMNRSKPRTVCAK